MAMVVVDRRRRRGREESLTVAELAALHLEAHRVLLLAAAATTGTRLVARRHHDGGRGHDRGGRDLLDRLDGGRRDLLDGRLDNLLLNNRLRLSDLHGLSGGGLGLRF